MTEPLIHEATKKLINNYLVDPGHPLLLVGPDGIGKSFFAAWIISSISKRNVNDLTVYPDVLLISPIDNVISIEQIRDIREFIKLKMLGDKPIRRYIVIEHANKMARGAQNALLKLLEEPPHDTLIILTAMNRRSLLETIVSRCHLINISMPNEDETRRFFSNQNDDEKHFSQMYSLTGGLPGLLKSLIDQSNDHPLTEAVSQAKKLLSSTSFERLTMVDDLSKQKDNLEAVLNVLIRIADTGMQQAAKKNDEKTIVRWLNVLSNSYMIKNALNHNAYTKLALTSLMLDL